MPFIFHDQTVAVITVGVTFEPLWSRIFVRRGYANQKIVFECFEIISSLEVLPGPFAVAFMREGLFGMLLHYLDESLTLLFC